MFKSSHNLMLAVYLCFMPNMVLAEPEPKDQLNDYYFAAARMGDMELMQAFLEAGFSANLANDKGYTPIMIAAYQGQENMVNYLLEQGADPCAEDKRGNTALMAAIFRAEVFIAKTLLTQDCSPNHQNKAGQTPLMYAALFDRQSVIDYLRDKGANVKLQDNSGNDAMSLAISQGNQRLASRLQAAQASSVEASSTQ